ncbi:transmembrane gamma-carboxyglutamic acid protein 2 isoform 2-T2 [Anableps anableps]
MGQLKGWWCSCVGQLFSLMAALPWIAVLSLLQMAHCYVHYQQAQGDPVFLDGQSATSFMSRSLLYNHWDFELVVQGDLERECIEEMCSYEEAREYYEDDALTTQFWETYKDKYVLGVYVYKNKKKPRTRLGRAPVRMAEDGFPVPEAVPLSGVVVPPPPLPSYNDALTHCGQHDAPPPPYSGGAPSEPAEPGDD